MQRILSTNVTRLIVEICSSYVNTHEGHYNCDGPRIYATAPLPYIILDGYGVHTAPVKFVQQKFRRHGAGIAPVTFSTVTAQI